MPRKLKRPAEVVAFGRVIVDDVEDHLDAGIMQPIDGRAQRVQRSVARIGGEEVQRVVAPVVAQPARRPGKVRR